MSAISGNLGAARGRLREVSPALRVLEQDLRPFFTPKTLAAYLSISERTVRQMLTDRRIASYRVEGQRRIAPEDVEAYTGRLVILEPTQRETIARRDPMPTLGTYDQWEADERAYAEILTRDPCCYCGAPMGAVDHIEPRARGGEHRWENLTSSCTRCNSAKQARSLLTFLRGRGDR